MKLHFYHHPSPNFSHIWITIIPSKTRHLRRHTIPKTIFPLYPWDTLISYNTSKEMLYAMSFQVLHPRQKVLAAVCLGRSQWPVSSSVKLKDSSAWHSTLPMLSLQKPSAVQYHKPQHWGKLEGRDKDLMRATELGGISKGIIKG